MKTAIDWLIEQTRNPDWHSLKRGEIIEIAKEKEKQQIIDAYESGVRYEYASGDSYFNQTFNIKEVK